MPRAGGEGPRGRPVIGEAHKSRRYALHLRYLALNAWRLARARGMHFSPDDPIARAACHEANAAEYDRLADRASSLVDAAAWQDIADHEMAESIAIGLRRRNAERGPPRGRGHANASHPARSVRRDVGSRTAPLPRARPVAGERASAASPSRPMTRSNVPHVAKPTRRSSTAWLPQPGHHGRLPYGVRWRTPRWRKPSRSSPRHSAPGKPQSGRTTMPAGRRSATLRPSSLWRTSISVRERASLCPLPHPAQRPRAPLHDRGSASSPWRASSPRPSTGCGQATFPTRQAHRPGRRSGARQVVHHHCPRRCGNHGDYTRLHGARTRPPADVFFVTYEDGVRDTIVPRLRAAGADLARAHVIQGITRDSGDEDLVTFPDDVPDLELAAQERRPCLVVVDPLSAALSGRIHSYKDQDVRRALARIARFAEVARAAVVVIRHLNKGSGRSAILSGGGSIGIAGAARSVLVVGAGEGEPTSCVLAVVKCNLAPRAPSLTYTIPAQNRWPADRPVARRHVGHRRRDIRRPSRRSP